MAKVHSYILQTTNWVDEYKGGCKTFEDDPRLEWPADETDPQTVAQVNAEIMEDRHIKVVNTSTEF